jgi:hypothetical protein
MQAESGLPQYPLSFPVRRKGVTEGEGPEDLKRSDTKGSASLDCDTEVVPVAKAPGAEAKVESNANHNAAKGAIAYLIWVQEL